MAADILVIGDINVDLAASIPTFPAEGDDIAIEGLNWCSGGAGVNCATALGLLGASVALFGRIGNDATAQVALRAASEAGVQLEFVQRDPTRPTGLCVAAVSPGGQRTFLSLRGANVYLDSTNLSASLHEAQALHLCGHVLLDDPQCQTALEAVELAEAHGVFVSLDLCVPTVRQRRNLVLELLPRIGLLCMNEDELSFLWPGHERDAILDMLFERGATLVGLKLGARGCLIATRHQRLTLAPVSVEAVDTNGCGDAFVAGFLMGSPGTELEFAL